MIVYSGTIKEFRDNVIAGTMTDLIEKEFRTRHISSNLKSEARAWDNSLKDMEMVLQDPDIDNQIKVAIEYQIPATSKRVDFILSGKDEDDKETAVIIELKQWEKAERTSRKDTVTTYLGGGHRAVVHPSYQAYSYVKTIENYSEYLQLKSIELKPCAYLHNYKEEYRNELDNVLYNHITKVAPLFLKRDRLKLREFIKTYIKKSDNGELLYNIENGKIRPSKALQDAMVSMLEGNQEFYMIDEQQVVFSTIKRVLELSQQKGNKKYTVIVEGGPGTGKSVLAINLLVAFRKHIAHYVTKNAAPRNVYFNKLRQEKYKWNYINNLFKSSGVYVDAKTNSIDCILVDEAHRLNKKSGMFSHLGENQIKEIISASKVSVFFIDEDQIVTTKDFGSVQEIKKQAELLGSEVLSGEDYNLVSQFRCNGSDGYLAFLDDVLEIRETANYDGFDMEYDIKIYDNPSKMREDLREVNTLNNKARLLAGYCYDWKTKKANDAYTFDIVLDNDFKAKWNFNNTKTWAIDEDSFDQVGCIHTSQGLEFDYVGVIIGKDLRYENGKVITDYNERAKTDHSLKGMKKYKQYDLADTIIRNTYRTLLTRGQKGCYIYCEDKKLSDYIKSRLHGGKDE